MEPAAIPVLDRARLDDLAEDLASRSDALDFAVAFIKLLPRRIHAIAAAIDAGRTDAAHVVLVSLGTSAAMVGALRLERTVRQLVDDVRAGHTELARETLCSLVGDADAVAAALAEALDGGWRVGGQGLRRAGPSSRSPRRAPFG